MMGPSALARNPWTWILLVVALMARLTLVGAGSHGLEAIEFTLSHDVGREDSRAMYLYEQTAADAGHAFWARPLFHLLLYPWTQLGLPATRAFIALASAVSAVMSFVWLRREGVGSGVSFFAGAVVALYPALVVESTRVLPASLAAPVVLLALVSRQAGRWGLSVFLLVAASWMDESAALVLLALLGLEVVTGQRRKESTLWPVELTRVQTGHLYGFVLAILPALLHADVALRDGPDPWNPVSPRMLLSALFLGGWLVPFIIFGLRESGSRLLCAATLGLVCAALLLNMVGRESGVGFALIAAPLGIMGSAILVSTIARGVGRAAGRTVGAAAVVILILSLLGPDMAAARVAVAPLDPASVPFLRAIERTSSAPRTQDDAAGHLDPGRWQDLFLVDVPWYATYQPFKYRLDAQETRLVYTVDVRDLNAWVPWLERATGVTVLLKATTPLNTILQDVYKPCIAYENVDYVLFDGSTCIGHASELWERWNATKAP